MGCTQNYKPVLGAIALLLFWVFPGSDTYAEDTDLATQSTATYEEHCGACHGYDGVPMLPGAPSFAAGERLEKADAELLKSIAEGKGEIMPPWSEVLSEEQRIEVLRYVRKLAAIQAGSAE